MSERFDYSSSERGPAQKKEILERGWQERLRKAVDREGTASTEVARLKGLIRQASGICKGVLVVDGLLRDSLLVAKAAEEDFRERGAKSSRAVSVVGQSVDNAIAAAYGISALVAPSQEIGHSVGYATGQGQEMSPDAQIVVSTPGNMTRHVLSGRARKESVGTIVVDGADSNSLYNQLLISALKEQHDAGVAPLIVLLSRRLDRVQKIADFFGVTPFNLRAVPDDEAQGIMERMDLKLPRTILYEEAREPFHIDQSGRATELLLQVLQGREHARDNVIVFARDQNMQKDIVRGLRAGWRSGFVDRTSSGDLETSSHIIQVLSEETPLHDRLALQLGKKEESTRRQDLPKSRMVISSLPVEMLGVVGDFNMVIDTYRSKEAGGYHSISRDEADRRASYAGENGICYRLTTRSEYASPRYVGSDGEAEFTLSSQERSKFDEAVRAAGRDPETFPHTFISEFGWEAKEEIAQIDPAIERWVQILGVEPPVARTVDILEKRGQLEVGLAIAACIRETRILKEDALSYALARHYGIPYSDVLLRLRVIADYLQPEEYREREEDDNEWLEMLHSKQEVESQFNPQSLSHVRAMLQRWESALKRKINLRELAERIRGLDSETLTMVLAQAMPERLAYTRYGEMVFADKRTGNQYMQVGRGSVVHGDQSPFMLPISTAGKRGEFITTGHPLAIEQALLFFPDKVRREEGKPFFEKQTGKVVQRDTIELFQRGSWPGEEGRWEAVEVATHEVESTAADVILEAEERRKREVVELKTTIQERLQFPFGVLHAITDRIKVGAVRTSAQDRLAALEKVQRDLNEDKVDDPSVTSAAIDDQIGKLSLLSRKAAKEAGWNSNWFEELEQTFHGIPEAIARHSFAQEVVASGVPATDIERQVRNQVLLEGIKIAQEGKKISLEEMINAILDEIVR